MVAAMNWIVDHWFQISALVLLALIFAEMPSRLSLAAALGILEGKLNDALNRIASIEETLRKVEADLRHLP